MGQSVICAAASAPAEPIVSVPVSDACCDLLELFAGVSDGRVGQGRDHPVAAVLALAAAAVVAGMKGYTAITGWVADVPPAILADLYLRTGAAPAPPPSKTTIWRVLTDADTEAFDAAVGTWLMDLAGSATRSTKKTNPRSEPDPDPESWLLSATSQSGHCAWLGASISPKPPDGPDAPWTAPSPSSDSHHDLGTAVAGGQAGGHRGRPARRAGTTYARGPAGRAGASWR